MSQPQPQPPLLPDDLGGMNLFQFVTSIALGIQDPVLQDQLDFRDLAARGIATWVTAEVSARQMLQGEPEIILGTIAQAASLVRITRIARMYFLPAGVQNGIFSDRDAIISLLAYWGLFSLIDQPRADAHMYDWVSDLVEWENFQICSIHGILEQEEYPLGCGVGTKPLNIQNNEPPAGPDAPLALEDTLMCGLLYCKSNAFESPQNTIEGIRVRYARRRASATISNFQDLPIPCFNNDSDSSGVWEYSGCGGGNTKWITSVLDERLTAAGDRLRPLRQSTTVMMMISTISTIWLQPQWQQRAPSADDFRSMRPRRTAFNGYNDGLGVCIKASLDGFGFDRGGIPRNKLDACAGRLGEDRSEVEEKRWWCHDYIEK
ncbi:hypothetical protein FIBSPDRAFT_882345 [Athelia psychrophila]|uniref:Uncharacterized protein n=1 Tax=Athelia psychrophila TaxID=1759441 RepID=A0A166V8X7_9AGAM|nr:hypothetical protein FIBSPDRAFT_882345 [Fibularhizoctonia sp. CBS 109695]